jgi:hypothetical protein
MDCPMTTLPFISMTIDPVCAAIVIHQAWCACL